MKLKESSGIYVDERIRPLKEEEWSEDHPCRKCKKKESTVYNPECRRCIIEEIYEKRNKWIGFEEKEGKIEKKRIEIRERR